jgi:hypothetical protein
MQSSLSELAKYLKTAISDWSDEKRLTIGFPWYGDNVKFNLTKEDRDKLNQLIKAGSIFINDNDTIHFKIIAFSYVVRDEGMNDNANNTVELKDITVDRDFRTGPPEFN